MIYTSLSLSLSRSLSLSLSFFLARLVVPHDPTTIMHIRSGNRSFLFFWALVLPHRLATSMAKGKLKRPRAQLRPWLRGKGWQGMATQNWRARGNMLEEHLIAEFGESKVKRLKFDTCSNLYQFVSLISVNCWFSTARLEDCRVDQSFTRMWQRPWRRMPQKWLQVACWAMESNGAWIQIWGIPVSDD